jgi:hypothetical protein
MVNDWAALSGELVLAILIEILVGAVILQLSCALYNLFAGAWRNHNGATAAWLPRYALKSGADRALYHRSGTFRGVPRPDGDRHEEVVLPPT